MLKEAMNAARVVKSPYEIKMLRKANEISAQAHINVLRSLKHLTNEAEIEAVFTATCIAKQAKQQAYGVIAGAGENASTLHYVANNAPLDGRQLVCLDAGCEWDCYASDGTYPENGHDRPGCAAANTRVVTRTFPISGEFTPEAKKIYDLVAKMQEECISMVKPGADFIKINQHAVKVATEGLLDLGLLVNGTLGEVYESHAAIAFFPHGVS
jgi:Xaa-Pro dipeptidase